MRLTMKKIVQMINEAFVRLEINEFEAYNCYNPRHRSTDIEAGCCVLVVNCRKKNDTSIYPNFNLLSFQFRAQLEKEINKGAVLTIIPDRFGGLSDAEFKPIFLPKQTI